MPDKAAFLTFLVAAFALNLAPGPDMLYVIGRSVGQVGLVDEGGGRCPAGGGSTGLEGVPPPLSDRRRRGWS